MQTLFDAIQDRFDEDGMLPVLGRKIYQGFENERAKTVLPFVDVTFVGPSQMDTFGNDVEELTAIVSAFTKRIRPRDAALLKEALMRVYDDCNLHHGEFYTVGFSRESAHGPVLRDGVYQSTIDYRVLVQRTVMVPAVRGM